MCYECFGNPINAFASAKEFTDFEQMLSQKLSEEKIVRSKPLELDKIINADRAFVCTACSETWILSEPDNAWRGYFLPQPAAVNHTKQLHKSNKAKQLLGFFLFIALLALICRAFL